MSLGFEFKHLLTHIPLAYIALDAFFNILFQIIATSAMSGGVMENYD